jgi:peptidoglycan/LPS O-acetylase OafA/YrhL
MLMLGLLLAAEYVVIARNHAAVALIRRVADGTFALYLIHLPLFMLFAAYVPYDHASTWQKLILLTLTTAIAVALAGPADSLKLWIRKSLASYPPLKARATQV